MTNVIIIFYRKKKLLKLVSRDSDNHQGHVTCDLSAVRVMSQNAHFHVEGVAIWSDNGSY